MIEDSTPPVIAASSVMRENITEQEQSGGDAPFDGKIPVQSMKPEEASVSNEPKSTRDRPSPILQYAPLNEDLNEIRLLKLLPDDDSDILRSTLSHASLKMPPAYAALSYCWGDRNDTRTIIVNNCAFQATANLEAGLRELRNRGVLVLWVDALCINQENRAERGHQISFMADIYSKATETISWLGVDNRNYASDAFFVMELMANEYPSRNGKEVIQNLSDEKNVHDPLWRAFRHFCEVEYWRRTWVIQEMVLSSKVSVAWGQNTISLRTVRRSLTTIGFEPKFMVIRLYLKGRSHGFVVLNKMCQLLRMALHGNGPALRLVNALDLTHGSHASEIRDKIFGILALCRDASIMVESPSYEQPLEAILHQIAANMVIQDNRPEVICLKSEFHQDYRSFPSWVPDWQDSWEPGGDHHWISLRSRRLCNYYQASGTSQQDIALIRNRNVLQTQGLVFDYITEAKDLHSVTESGIMDARFQDGSALFTPQRSIYGHFQTRDAIWRTLVMDRRKAWSNKRAKAPPEGGQHFSKLWAESSPTMSKTLNTWTREDLRAYACLSRLEVFGKSIREWAHEELREPISSTSFDIHPSTSNRTEERTSARGYVEDDHWSLSNFLESLSALDGLCRCIITTQKGYLGLGHTQCRPGDQICLLAGFSVPVILRECEGGHTVVGEAYVHGIMEGEGWDENLLRTFLIH